MRAAGKNHDKYSMEHYGHLVNSIMNVRKYSESPVPMIQRNVLAPKTLPLLNRALVKVLKDAVNNYGTAFNFVMKDFVHKSKLYFYTCSAFDEFTLDEFNWSSFDIGRLKAMDFELRWKKGREEVIAPAGLGKVKGLLLIMHIINYLSVFKFIIIDEKIFEVSLRLN